MFTLAISSLTTSHLPWFMDLTFQVPMQYCSLQHQTWLSPPDTSTTGIVSAQRGSASSFFLELFLCSSPVAYWAPTNLESSSFHVISFCLFILFMGFSRQEYWSGLRSLLQWATFCQNSSPWLLDSINRHDTSNITSHFLSLFFRNLEPWNKEKKKLPTILYLVPLLHYV